MSAVVIVPIILPVIAPVAWPLFATAAVAAAASLGFAALSAKNANSTTTTSVELGTDNLQELQAGLSHGESLVFGKDGVTIEVLRNATGKISVRVEGCHRSKAELRQIGEAMVGRLVQQYAYHRVVTELQQRNMPPVEQEVEEDGTVHLKVRIYQD